MEAENWSDAWYHCVTLDGLGGPQLTSDRPEFWKTAADMVRIPASEFQMGDPHWNYPSRRDERLHRAQIPEPLLVSRTEVGQALWDRVMDDNPSRFRGHDLPVDSVKWNLAVTFCNRLSEKAQLQPAYSGSGDTTHWDRAANGFRIPTETEWEYFARGGTSTQFSTGDTLYGNQANFDIAAEYQPGNTGDKLKPATRPYLGRTTPLASYPPNPWGLHDIHGNVWEWCWDHYGTYPGGDYGDLPLGSGPDGDYGGSKAPPKARILRGGAWGYSAYYCRSAFRGRLVPGYRYTLRVDQLGLRVIRTDPTI